MRFYHYLFYRIWDWYREKWGEADLPQATTVMALGIMAAVNLANVLTLVAILFHITVSWWSLPKPVIVGVAFVSVGLHALYFLPKKRYLKFAADFANETPKARRLGGIAVVIYTLWSLSGWMLLLMLRGRETG